MAYIVHEGIDYIALMKPNETTDNATATFRFMNDAQRAARLLNTFKATAGSCKHFFVTDHTGVAELCTKCGTIRA